MTEPLKRPPGKTDLPGVPVQDGLFDWPPKKDQHPALIANRCKCCGNRFFPRRTLCPYCFDQGDMEDVRLERRGLIYSCTTVHISSPAGIKAPYAYGYVDIPADDIRVFALFTGEDPFSFKSGQEVELVIEPVITNEAGQPIIGYKFKPVS